MINDFPICKDCSCEIIDRKNEGVYQEALCEHCERSRIESFDKTLADHDYTLWRISTEDAQEIARKALGRDLSPKELEIIQQNLDLPWAEHLDLFIEYRFAD